tara:strand:- start:716 stop:955 length:240 start_codon:yes stop_codon:yes gene_type:complete
MSGYQNYGVNGQLSNIRQYFDWCEDIGSTEKVDDGVVYNMNDGGVVRIGRFGRSSQNRVEMKNCDPDLVRDVERMVYDL